jgi:glycosyltransferase involved in cell wall biosynthesis
VKIALDASYTLTREPTGVASYSDNIIRALTQSAPDHSFLLCYRANRYLRGLRAPLPAANCSRALLEGPAAFFYRSGVALFHGLNQRLPSTRFRRAVTTFHDLFVMSGDYSTPEFRSRFTALAKDAALRSDHIIAISRYTADQLVQRLNYPRERITVIHHGVHPVPHFSELDLALFRKREQLDAPFVLHVGAIQTRKNIERLIAAFEQLPPPALLVLAGAEGYGSEGSLRRIQTSPARERIRHFGYVDAGMLARLYRTASVLAFPSLEEGFGLPVLEAMSAGLPVVTSNRSALPEVAGDTALLVDPEDSTAIAGAIGRILEDPGLRRQLIAAGLARAGQFSWTKAAHETLEVYDKLA